MEEKKLTDEEVVKALEVCGKDFECHNCPYVDECCERLDGSAGLLIQALDLIHRLQAENERLTEEKETAWRKFKEKCNESIELHMLLDKRATERVELQKQVDTWKAECQELHDECEGCFAKAKGIKEQIEKDTAKEILQMADKINKGGQNDLCELEVAIKERYGVEVE